MKFIGHKQTIQRIPPIHNLPPALFIGPSGVGKMTFIRHILLRSTSPHTIKTLLKPSVDDIREIIDWSHTKALGGKDKIIIINITNASKEAQNALLKTLEEPPPSFKMILISHSMRVLMTIFSRCQVFRFLPLSEVEIVEILTQLGIDKPTAVSAAELADGSVEKALRFKEIREMLMSMDSILSKASPAEIAEDILTWRPRSIDETVAVIDLLQLTNNISPLELHYLSKQSGARGKTLLALMHRQWQP